MNKFLVAAKLGPTPVYGPIMPICWPLNAEECANLAAWLVAISGTEEQFQQELKAAQES